MKGRFLPDLCEILEFLFLCENYLHLKASATKRARRQVLEPSTFDNSQESSSPDSPSSSSSDSSDNSLDCDTNIACLSKHDIKILLLTKHVDSAILEMLLQVKKCNQVYNCNVNASLEQKANELVDMISKVKKRLSTEKNISKNKRIGNIQKNGIKPFQCRANEPEKTMSRNPSPAFQNDI